ncbi:MAG: cadmium-translocating P-type ATPase [Neisseriaceae bacterium]|nr:cadmium-translocating P-type ATPase [Neisseriaceae bacterium]
MNNKCFHCGLDVPADLNLTVKYQGEEKETCCIGCQTIAQGIIDAGLERYYEQRTAEANQATLPPQEVLDRLKLYDLPQMQTTFVEVKDGNQKEALLLLSGITCAACVWLIEQRLLHCNGIIKVELNYSTHRARITWDDTQIKISDILLLIQQTGYEACPYDAMQAEQQTQLERKRSLTRLWVAGLSMMQVMMYAVPTYIFGDIEPQFLWLLHWASMVLTLPVVLYSALPFYRGALRDAKNRRVGMDTPITIAVILAFSASFIALLRHENSGVFFDSISMFVFLLLGGRYLEQRARTKASDASERLVKLVPAFCHLLPDYPNQQQPQEAAVVQIESGNILLVKAGEVIPADGEIISGESEVNESMLTGESMPIFKTIGHTITAGTLNMSSPLIMRVDKIGNNTRLGSIIRLLDKTLSQKPKIAQIADRYASIFVASLLIVTVLVFLIWCVYADANRALWISVSLLVITCPCALSLATPTALVASAGNLSSNGILTINSSAVEILSKIDDVIFDKTGTLTEGKLKVQQTIISGSVDEKEIGAIVCAMETRSEHPIATALLSKYADYKQEIDTSDLHNVVGQGMSVKISNTEWRIGNLSYVSELSGEIPNTLNTASNGTTTIALGNEDGFQAFFQLTDTLKDNAYQTIEKLKQMSLDIHLLSGDGKDAVEQLAQQLNITNIRYQSSPEDKLLYVQQLQQKGRKVLMVGDGVNDAPVLAQADVSIAMHSGADISRAGSDMVLMNRNLFTLTHAINTAKRTMLIIKENIYWALSYNIIAIPIAALGYARPAVAALGMACSSLLVVCNALRLLKSNKVK